MKITKKSLASGLTHTMDLPITGQQWDRYLKRDGKVQDIFPELTPDQREFLISGTTKEEWAELFPPEEETENGF